MLSDFPNLEGGAKRGRWRAATIYRGMIDSRILDVVVGCELNLAWG
jgi:hypothetical protein